MVTACCSNARPTSSKAGNVLGANTKRPPLSNAPQISKVEASKANGASWKKISSLCKVA